MPSVEESPARKRSIISTGTEEGASIQNQPCRYRVAIAPRSVTHMSFSMYAWLKLKQTSTMKEKVTTCS